MSFQVNKFITVVVQLIFAFNRVHTIMFDIYRLPGILQEQNWAYKYTGKDKLHTTGWLLNMV